MITEKELQSIKAGMSEYFRMSDYRTMYDYFNKIIVPILESKVKNLNEETIMKPQTRCSLCNNVIELYNRNHAGEQ